MKPRKGSDTAIPVRPGKPVSVEKHSPDAPLSIHDLTVAYRRRPVLWDVDVEIPPESLVAIIGPNGAGKSTLIKAALGLVPRASGRVTFFGESLSKRRSDVAYVPQRESVDWDFPINALEVVTMGLYREIGWCRPVMKQHRMKAMEALEMVGMGGQAQSQISELSGGQQQRVFLARALVQDARLFLMDEPFAGVDAATGRAIVTLLHELRERGRTVVVVHHDLQTVESTFDHVVLLNMRVVAAGPVKSAFTEENLKATYGGRLTLLAEAASKVARQ